jgi:hypothetical protein
VPWSLVNLEVPCLLFFFAAISVVASVEAVVRGSLVVLGLWLPATLRINEPACAPVARSQFHDIKNFRPCFCLPRLLSLLDSLIASICQQALSAPLLLPITYCYF